MSDADKTLKKHEKGGVLVVHAFTLHQRKCPKSRIEIGPFEPCECGADELWEKHGAEVERLMKWLELPDLVIGDPRIQLSPHEVELLDKVIDPE